MSLMLGLVVCGLSTPTAPVAREHRCPTMLKMLLVSILAVVRFAASALVTVLKVLLSLFRLGGDVHARVMMPRPVTLRTEPDIDTPLSTGILVLAVKVMSEDQRAREQPSTIWALFCDGRRDCRARARCG